MVECILVLSSTGGNLVETFDNLSKTIRERQRIKEKIKVLTSEGKMQAIVIGALPLCLGFALYIVSPSYIRVMFETRLGLVLIALVLFLETIGVVWLRKIIDIKV